MLRVCGTVLYLSFSESSHAHVAHQLVDLLHFTLHLEKLEKNCSTVMGM